jgi:hypothetical protein
MNKQLLEEMAGRDINLKALARRTGISRQCFYDSFRRGYFTHRNAELIAKDLGITAKGKRARLLGVE